MKHITRLSRPGDRPRAADAADIAKYITQFLNIFSSVIGALDSWRNLQESKDPDPS
jgi:hypothetical protein